MQTRIYLIVIIFAALWCAGILASPLLKNAGYSRSPDILYSFFSRICHQEDARSLHIKGEKLGVCIRCSAIYFGFLAGALLMPLLGAHKKTRIPKPTFLIAVILPMLIDVVLNGAGLHTGTTLTRVITGALFGTAMSWCVVPLFIEASLQIIRQKKNSFIRFRSIYVRKTQ